MSRTTIHPDESYPSLSTYAFLSDCHSMALVGRGGSIDWCVMPRVDSPSVFGRILDHDRGGCCALHPDRPDYEASRRYLDGGLVLETTFRTEDGVVRLYDCFAMRTGGREAPYQQILRIVEGVEGSVPMRLRIEPRFDYGLLRPWMRRYGEKSLVALGGHQGLLFSGDYDLLSLRDDCCTCRIAVEAGQRRRLSILFREPHRLDDARVEIPSAQEMDERLETTTRWWREWSGAGHYDGPHREMVLRSAAVLKGLTNAPTGAIAAAATTSLPEVPGGARNWDYRFTWIRDSVFTVHSLISVGFPHEADGFRRFVERTAAGSAEEVQVLYGVGGEHHVAERALDELNGYRGARPVRVGNAAATQLQLDVYGELLDLARRWHERGNSPDPDYWRFIVDLVQGALDRWESPDQGIWEMRGAPRHFVQSKVMCWVAVDCGIRLAEETGAEAPLERWRAERERMRRRIEKEGYDAERGVFVQAFGDGRMDAALLLLPIFRFVAFEDERMVRTVDAIRAELEDHGFLNRYGPDGDGLPGREATFLPCTFWLAEVLARQGRRDEAREVFDRACATANDVGLFAEEYDPVAGEMRGNFPQGLTHLALIGAAVALDGTGEEKDGS